MMLPEPELPPLPEPSREMVEKLREIGFDLDWGIADSDATHILAFHKFLNSGEWVEIDGQKVFMVDQASFDYGSGKIDAETYLNADQET